MKLAPSAAEYANRFQPPSNPLRGGQGNDKIPSDVKLRALPFLWCSLALFIGGCPKRQAPTRIVYVPSPPPAPTQASAAGASSMVIEEPAPPEEPPAPSPQPTSPPKPARRPRRALRREAPAVENTPETTEPPAPQVPSLEPRQSSAQEVALRRQIQGLQDDVPAENRKTQPSGTIRRRSQNPRRCAYLFCTVH